jgi:hypothetical protein
VFRFSAHSHGYVLQTPQVVSSKFPAQEAGPQHPEGAADQREAKGAGVLDKVKGFYANTMRL